MPLTIPSPEEIQEIKDELAYMKSIVRELIGERTLGRMKRSELMEAMSVSRTTVDKLIVKRIITPIQDYEDGDAYFDRVEVYKSLLPRFKEVMKEL